MLAALDSESGRQFISQTARIIKDRLFLILTQLEQADFTAILIQKDVKEVTLPDAKLSISIEDATKTTIKKEKVCAYLDIDKLEFPLVLRQWKKGDYFYPFGMVMKKKKVSKYFKDQKIAIHEKEKVWILESNKKIVWITGERIDERFKVSPKTKSILVLKFNKMYTDS